MLAASVLGLSPWAVVIALTIVVIGSATQASIGVGLGLLAAPTLSLLDPGFVPGALALGVVPLTVGMTIREHQHIDVGIWRAVVGRIVGVLIGAWIVADASQELIALVIGISVLVAVIASLSGFTFASSTRNLLIAGTVSGFSGTVASIGGPPMALTYQHADPRTLRASLAAFNTAGSVFTIPALVIAGVLGSREVQLAALLVPGVLAGLLIGRIGVARLPAHRVRPFVLAACTASATVLLVEQFV